MWEGRDGVMWRGERSDGEGKGGGRGGREGYGKGEGRGKGRTVGAFGQIKIYDYTPGRPP